MAKKKTLEDLIIEGWEGTRNENQFFKDKSDDFFVGYATGVTAIQNLNLKR